MTDEKPAVIRGTRPVLTRRNTGAIAVTSAGLLVLAFVRGTPDWTYLGMIAISLLGTFVSRLRPPTQITTAGIERPWCLRSFLTWASVDHFVEPTYLSDVRVTTTEGKTLRLFGIDASLTAGVAELGSKPTRSQQVPTPRTVSKEPTQREIEADVARRAAALAAERQQMEDSNKRRQGR